MTQLAIIHQRGAGRAAEFVLSDDRYLRRLHGTKEIFSSRNLSLKSRVAWINNRNDHMNYCFPPFQNNKYFIFNIFTKFRMCHFFSFWNTPKSSKLIKIKDCQLIIARAHGQWLLISWTVCLKKKCNFIETTYCWI